MTSLEAGEMQPQHSPGGSKSSLDDAFQSLEQLLHVLQGASSAVDSEQAGDDLSPTRFRSAAAAVPALDASPSAGSGLGATFQRTSSSWPQAAGRARPHNLSDFSELLQAAETGLFSPGSCRERADTNTTVTPLAWHEEAPQLGRLGLLAPMDSMGEDPSTSAEELPCSGRSFLADHEQESGALPVGSALCELGPAEVLAALQRREAELAELKALWLHESSRLQRLVELREKELADLKSQHEDGLGPLPVFPRAKAGGRVEASVQCDTTSEPLRSCEEELCRMAALVQAGAEELSSLKRQHEAELGQMRALLGAREEELAALKVRHQEQASMPEGAAGQSDELQAVLRDREEEVLRLKSELLSTNFKLNRLHSQQEKELEDCAEFLQRLALSSSIPALGLSFDLSTAEVLGMGNYGYILTCRSKKSGDRVVVKLQSVRWAGVAVKEWAHGSQLSGHSHIVSYIEAIMHRDASMEIENLLKAGFDNGILTRRRPKFFPDCYFCLALEYMDRGTVQNYMDRHPLTPESLGAITRQVASALAFMHKRKRTHNDIKPENILLREAPRGDCLVAKLADLGLADHSSERARDQELFGYTVWCMGLRERFERCPSGDSEREAAVARFRQAAPTQKPSRDIWEVLAKMVAKMWQGSLDMVEVEGADRLQGLQVALPSTREEAVDLEASAKLDLQRRTNIGWRTHRWRHRGSIHSMMDMHVDENGCKIADSEPEEEREEEEEEEEGPLMAATWPPARR